MFFFLKFSETVRAEEEDQVGLQAPEDPHDSSTDTCPTFPYSSDSPRPFPPSPVHTVTDSPIRVSLLTIITDNPSGDDSPIHRSSGHNSPTPTSSTPPVLTFSQTSTSLPSIQTTNPSNNPFYSPYFSSSFLHSGPIVFPGSPPEFLILGSHFLGPVLPSLKLFPFLIVLYLPGLLLLLNPNLSFPLSLSPWPALGLAEDMAEDPGVLILGGEELPEAEGAGPPPPPAARPLPFPAIFGLTINHLWSLLRILLLMKP